MPDPYSIFLNASPKTVAIFIALAIWTIIWKGLALWRAAGRKEKAWFVVLLIVNTFGILEILYLRIFSKRTDQN